MAWSDRDRKQLHPRSHLFTVRLRPEPLGDGRTEWRGKVQHLTSGEARYFRDWPALLGFMESMLQRLDETEAPMGTT